MPRFTVTGKVNYNNQTTSRTFQVRAGALTDLDPLIALMEGEVSVKEEVAVAGSSTTLVSTAQEISQIIMSSDQGYKAAYISSFDGKPLLFKASASTDDIKNALINLQPFYVNGAEVADKPSSISIRDYNKIS